MPDLLPVECVYSGKLQKSEQTANAFNTHRRGWRAPLREARSKQRMRGMLNVTALLSLAGPRVALRMTLWGTGIKKGDQSLVRLLMFVIYKHHKPWVRPQARCQRVVKPGRVGSQITKIRTDSPGRRSCIGSNVYIRGEHGMSLRTPTHARDSRLDLKR